MDEWSTRDPRAALGESRVIERGTGAYPAALLDLSRPPERLFVAGSIGPLERVVAVVGTRRASPDAGAVARAMGRALARSGVLVVSGAAQGIDGEAHAGALDALADAAESDSNARTVAVIATPLEAPYPAAHLPLLRAIVARGGGVVTEAPAGQKTFRASFLARNRIVAALAHAVVVVEAPARSGTLSTVHHARALGRPIFAVPWSVLDDHRAGGVALLARGEARACRDAGDVLDALGWSRPVAAREAGRPRRTEPAVVGTAEARVLATLARGASHLDAIVEGSRLAVPDVQAALLSLVLDGRIVERGGCYRASR